jgi:hypothetical protein
MIIEFSMGLTTSMAIQNSRTLAQNITTKNSHGKNETGATTRAEILFKNSYGQNSVRSLDLSLEVRLLLNFVIVSVPRHVSVTNNTVHTNFTGTA